MLNKSCTFFEFFYFPVIFNASLQFLVVFRQTLKFKIFCFQNLQKGKVSMADMVFGMQMKDTGIKRYPYRARTRTIQYAITLVFSQFHEGLVFMF